MIKERIVQHAFNACGWQSPLRFTGTVAQDNSNRSVNPSSNPGTGV
jgi:hypothetical protein